MNIVIGRGNKRMVAVVPCAAIIKASEPSEQAKMVSDFCKLAGIKETAQ